MQCIVVLFKENKEREVHFDVIEGKYPHINNSCATRKKLHISSQPIFCSAISSLGYLLFVSGKGAYKGPMTVKEFRLAVSIHMGITDKRNISNLSHLPTIGKALIEPAS